MLNSFFDMLAGGKVDFMSIVVQLCALLLIIFIVLPFHEWAHAFAALKLGDTSIKYRGRLSLNPLNHIDYMGALCLLLFGFGWAKPVPVDDRHFKNPKVGMAITALAGPLANIVAAMAGALIYLAVILSNPSLIIVDTLTVEHVAAGYTLVDIIGSSYVLFPGSEVAGLIYYVMIFLSYYVAINCALAVFNLLPIPPLDGSKIMFVFMPDKWVYKFYQYQQYIMIGLFALLWLGFLDGPLAFLQNGLSNFVYWFCMLPYKLFGLF